MQSSEVDTVNNIERYFSAEYFKRGEHVSQSSTDFIGYSLYYCNEWRSAERSIWLVCGQYFWYPLAVCKQWSRVGLSKAVINPHITYLSSNNSDMRCSTSITTWFWLDIRKHQRCLATSENRSIYYITQQTYITMCSSLSLVAGTETSSDTKRDFCDFYQTYSSSLLRSTRFCFSSKPQKW